MCEPSKCHASCEQPPNADCDIKCEEPVCQVQCPDKPYETGVAPQCITICDDPKCVTHCHAPKPTCEVVCTDPTCKYECHQPACPKPKCELVCENPDCTPEKSECCQCDKDNKVGAFTMPVFKETEMNKSCCQCKTGW